MIIIKGQDDNIIVECKKVEYWKTNKETFEIATNYKYYVDGMGGVDETFDKLGIYKTEERAKEVMDMIEEHIREKHLNNMIINMVNVTQVNFTQMYDVLKSSGHGNEAIFEMPKE